MLIVVQFYTLLVITQVEIRMIPEQFLKELQLLQDGIHSDQMGLMVIQILFMLLQEEIVKLVQLWIDIPQEGLELI